jgi:multiple sugar transport system substrate-binding protein
MTISSTSAHKDEAFKVLSVALSDEVQTDLSRNAQMSVLKDRNVQEQFGKAFAGYDSKNVLALTKLKLAVIHPFKYTFTPSPAALIMNAFNSVLYDGKDINTALREADELMTKSINAELANKR